MVAVIGVDEAGRGPVLGSLFVGAVKVDDRTCLPAGVGDSKAIAPAKRAEVAASLEETHGIDTTFLELDAATIDGSPVSLTEQVAAAFATAIDRLADDGDSVVVDAGEADTERFAGRVRTHLDRSVDLTAAIRADETDPLVGAASIVAKEAREAHVAVLADRFGDIGSGYPSDPLTREFLAAYVETNGRLPACARTSWSTSRDAIEAAEQSALSAFVETGRDG